MLSEEHLISLEPNPDAEQIRKILRLQTDGENMRHKIERCRLAHKDSMDVVHAALQANVVISEENKRLKSALATELGGEWLHDPNDTMHIDMLWESFFAKLVQHTEKTVLVPHTAMDR